MRRVFLWAARNRWLKEHLPRFHSCKRGPPVYARGDARGRARRRAASQAAGVASMYTRLGENLEHVDEADAIAAHYLEVVDKIVAGGIEGPVSVKPTQLGMDLGPDICSVTWCASPIKRPPPAPTSATTWNRAPTSSRPASCTNVCTPSGRVRHLPAGVSPPDRRRRRAAAPHRSGYPPRQGRLQREGVDRLQSRRSIDASYPGPHRRLPAREPRATDSGWASGPTTWPCSGRSPTRSRPPDRQGRVRGRDALGIRTDQQLRLARAGYRVVSLIAYGEYWYPWYMRRLASGRPTSGSRSARCCPSESGSTLGGTQDRSDQSRS